MPFRVAALFALVLAGAALSGGFVASAPAGPQPPPLSVGHYDPLPR